MAYGEVNVTFQGPFPERITLSPAEVVINYDQALSVTVSRNTFEVRLNDDHQQSKRHRQLTTSLALVYFNPDLLFRDAADVRVQLQLGQSSRQAVERHRGCVKLSRVPTHCRSDWTPLRVEGLALRLQGLSSLQCQQQFAGTSVY